MTKSMFVSLLLCLVQSEYVEITSSNVKQLIGGPRPIFVKFYLQTCGHCRAMAEDFAEASATFTNVTFGGIDCKEESKICKRYKVKGYPTIYLFPAGKTTGIEFDGTRSVDGFCDFIENYTTFRAKRPPKVLVELNPLNFDHYLNQSQCLFVTFYAPWCGHCQHFLPQAKIAAKALQPDTNVILGVLNGDQYREFSAPYVKGFPSIKAWINNETIDYTGGRRAGDVISFINEKCGTQRLISGYLNEKAGLIDAASAIVAEFLIAEDKKSYIPKIKEIPGAEFYLKVMERYINKGPEQIKKDMNTIMVILETKKGSWQSMDGMKKRFNVFAEFFPKPATPTPTPPPPELTDAEVAAENAEAEELKTGKSPAQLNDDEHEGSPSPPEIEVPEAGL
jgi:protein disulfide-isomerase A6